MKSAISTLMIMLLSISTYAQKDNGIIQIYKGSKSINHEVVEKGEYNYATNPKREGIMSSFSEYKTIAGKVTKSEYKVETDDDINSVYKYFDKALKSRNFKVVFKCNGNDCVDDVYPIGQTLVEGDYIKSPSRELWKGFIDNNAYIVARRKTINQIEHVILLAGQENDKNVYYRLDIVERENLEVPTTEIKSSIDSKGKIALYNIYFESNATAVQKKSENVVRSVAKYLTDHPSVKVYIVGHLNVSNSHEKSMQQSQSQAEAVVYELTSKYKIPPSRVSGHGVGMLAPLNNGKTAKDKILNNRIEIVKRK